MHAPPENHETVECRLCGTQNDKDAENCRRCGMPLGLATRRPLDTVKLNRESDLEDPTTRPFEEPEPDFEFGKASDTRRLAVDEESAQELPPEPGEPGWLTDFHGVEGFDAPPAPSEAAEAADKLPPAEPAPDYDSGDLPGWLSDLAAQPMRSKAAPPPPDILEEPEAPAAKADAESIADDSGTDWSAAGDRTLLERHGRAGHSEEDRLPPIGGSPAREPSSPPVLSADEELPDWLAYLVNADTDEAVEAPTADEPTAEHEEDYSHEVGQEVGNEVADTWLADLGALTAMPFEKVEEAAKAIPAEPVEPSEEAKKVDETEVSEKAEETGELVAAEAVEEESPAAEAAEEAEVPEESKESDELATAEAEPEAKPEPPRPAAAVADNSLDIFGELLEPPDLFAHDNAPPAGQHDAAAELEGAFSIDAEAEEEGEAEPAAEGAAEAIAKTEAETAPEAIAEVETEAIEEAEAEEIDTEAEAVAEGEAEAEADATEEEPPEEEPPDGSDEPPKGGGSGGGTPSSPENVATVFHHAGGDPGAADAGWADDAILDATDPFPWELFDELPAIDAPPSADGLTLGDAPAPLADASPGDAPSVAGSVPPIADDEPSVDDILPAAEDIPPAPQPEPTAKQSPPTEQEPSAEETATDDAPPTPQKTETPYAEEDRPWGGDDPSAAEAIAADADGDAPPWGWPDPSADADAGLPQEDRNLLEEDDNLPEEGDEVAESLSTRIQDLRYEALTGDPPQGIPSNRELFGALQDVAGVVPPEPIFEGASLHAGRPDRTLEFSERQRRRIERLRWLLNEERRPVPLIRTRQAAVRIVGAIRRLVALIMILTIALPLVLGPLGLPGFATPTPSPEVGAAIDALDALGSQGRVLAVFEYGPDTAAELDPLAGALLERLATEPNIAVDAISTLPTGPAMAEAAFATAPIDKRLDDPEARWTNLGYLPGGATGVSALALGASPGVPSALAADRNGEPTGLDGTRLLAGPYDAIIVIAARPEDVQMWVEQAGQPTGLPIIAALSARAAPLAEPYRSSRQLVALLTGIPDAARLHAAEGGSPNRAVLALRDSQIAGSLAAALLIVLGALTYGLFTPRTARRPTP